MTIITRKEAKALGLKKYFTGELCKNGHLSERLTSGGECVECKRMYYVRHREAILVNVDSWRRKNPEKHREIQERYRLKNIEKIRRSVANNKEKIAVYREKYRMRVRVALRVLKELGINI